MNLFQRLTTPNRTPQRALVELINTMQGEPVESIGENFRSFVQRAYQDNGVIWAAVTARLVLFSQARFALRDKTSGEITDLPPRLAFLDRPYPGGSSAELLARIEQDTSLAGNYYILRAEPNRLQRLRPDWVDIITNSREPVAYAYYNGGDRTKSPRLLKLEEVAHGNPYPDPLKAFVGNSWVTSVVKDIMADQSMNTHKLKFFENAATPNMLIKLQQNLNEEQKSALQSALEARHQGAGNAWKTMVLEGGADAQVVGSTMDQVAFGDLQAGGENRIAVAARVPSIVLGIKEGAEQATYNNYGQAVRAFADHTMRHLWAHAATTLGQIVEVPAGKELWYDDRHIPALQSDAADEAAIRKEDAATIEAFIRGGFEPDSAVAAVIANDLSLLEHTGLVSVQLQPPGAEAPTETPDEIPEETEDERFARVIAELKEATWNR